MASFDSIRPEVRMVFRTELREYATGVEHHKYSLSYRLLLLMRGGFLLRLGDREEPCGEGDIIFMPPHEEYYTVFDGGDSMFLNIFFDFFPREGAVTAAKSMHDYFVMLGYEPLDTEKAAEKLTFEDTPVFNRTFVIRELPDWRNKCGELYRLWRSGGAHKRLRLHARLTELLADIADHVNAPRQNAGSVSAHAIVSYIDAHYDERLTCRSVAEKFSYHPNYVNRIVRELTGCSLHEYIIHVKVRHASQLLLETDMSITEIAYSLGFHDSSHFSSVFQARTGMKPSELRRNRRSNEQEKESDTVS